MICNFTDMSGHSKWATIKRQKAVTDAKKAAVFTRLANAITIAAKEKGGDPTTNFSLRLAIEKAREANMPKDNIERAIKRGTGELGGNALEELTYEGIGPAKTQFIIKCVTDSRNRSASTIRHAFSECGGALGAVSWNFEQKGVARILKNELEKINLSEELELELIDNGAQDIEKEEEGWTIYTKPEDLQRLKQFLEAKNITSESAKIECVAKEKQALSDEEKEKVEKFIETLEENEDVDDYYTNAII